jgi:hypothetical protein
MSSVYGFLGRKHHCNTGHDGDLFLFTQLYGLNHFAIAISPNFRENHRISEDITEF